MTCTRIHRLLGFAVLSSFFRRMWSSASLRLWELDDANEWDEAFDTEESVADEPEEEVDEAEQEDDDDTDGDTPGLECSNEGFDTIATQTTLNETNPDQIRFVHRAVNTTSPPNDELSLCPFKAAHTTGHRLRERTMLAGKTQQTVAYVYSYWQTALDPTAKRPFAKSGTLPDYCLWKGLAAHLRRY